jgi:hypothetical protein
MFVRIFRGPMGMGYGTFKKMFSIVRLCVALEIFILRPMGLLDSVV